MPLEQWADRAPLILAASVLACAVLGALAFGGAVAWLTRPREEGACNADRV